MFRSLSSKNRHGSSTSSSQRKKTGQSSRRAESVASSSSHRKHSRNDASSAKHEHQKSAPTEASVNRSSQPSSYYTASDGLNHVEPQSLTEEAIRSLGMQQDEWEDTPSRANNLPVKEDARTDKTHRSDNPYREEPEHNRYPYPDESIVTERSFSPSRSYPQNPAPMSSYVQDQFPDQDPSSYAFPAFDPNPTQGLAAEYYSGNQAQQQPHNADSAHSAYIPPASFTSAGHMPTTAAGAAAEYYSQIPVQTSEAVKPSFSSKLSNSPSRPTGRVELTNPAPVPYPVSPATAMNNGRAPVYVSNNNPERVHTVQQHPTSALSYNQNVDVAGTGPFQPYQHHVQSVPSTSTSNHQYYATNLPTQLPGQGKQSSMDHHPLYASAVAGMTADAYARHHHKTHQQTHFAPIGTMDASTLHGVASPLPYTSGSMAMKHRHKGPISKFVDWWKDYEDVRKMEEYTEFIGVCKYCFDPRSSISEAPRKHHYGGRRSSESLRRRSNDSLRYTNGHGSKAGRIDKDSRYHSSSESERRRKKTGWLGSGIAAYGLTKVGKSLWQNSRDFDDTYSVKSGRTGGTSRAGVGHARRNHSPSHRSQSERSEGGNKTTHRSYKNHSEISGSESKSGRGDLYGMAGAGMAAANVPLRHSEDKIHVRHPSPGYERPLWRNSHRPRNQSPSLGQILGFTSSAKRTYASASGSSSPQQESKYVDKLKDLNRTSSVHKRKKGFFNFANSSSSSADSDLAFGSVASRKGRPSKKIERKDSDEHLKATLLGIGATAAALGAVQGYTNRRVKLRDLRENRSKSISRDARRGKYAANDDEAWESATEDETDSVSSGLAFGDFDTKRKAPVRRSSSESITSQSSGTDKWSWRWRRKADKNASLANHPSYQRSQDEPAIAHHEPSGVLTSPIPSSQAYHSDMPPARDMTSLEHQPMQYVHPVPTSDPLHFDAKMPGAFPEQSNNRTSNRKNVSIQQPQPVTPIQPNVLYKQSSPPSAYNTHSFSSSSARPRPPTELRRTQSSPVSSHTMRNTAIAGFAGAAAAGILANGKNKSSRDASPSSVRFDLTDKQAKKEQREQRRAEAKENKDRARVDRERAMQAESARQATEDARRREVEAERQQQLVEEVERQQARLREQATVQDREREADERRQKEIEAFMQNALAEHAREAERKKQQETWEAQQMLPQQQQTRQDPWARPSSSSDAVHADDYEHRDVRPQIDRSHSTDLPYATRSYEPSNKHSGQPLMDDDLIGPDFITRRRSPSDLARYGESAKEAAARIVSDLEERYRDPVPSQADFFAPKELSMPSKGKTKVQEPAHDNDYHVYHMPEIQLTSMPNEPPPPYQAPYEYVDSRDGKGRVPWEVPKLNVIAPTPPTSHAGSAKGDKSPVVIPIPDSQEDRNRSDVDEGPHRASKVSWGEDQTRIYEISTPESSSQEYVVLPEERPHAPSALRTEFALSESPPEGSTRRNPTSSDTVYTSGADYPSDGSIEEVVRESPSTSPGRFYQQPFAESVSDVAFALDSPGTEGAPPVQGFVEGEIDYSSEPDDRMPHIPGGFEDPESEGIVDLNNIVQSTSLPEHDMQKSEDNFRQENSQDAHKHVEVSEHRIHDLDQSQSAQSGKRESSRLASEEESQLNSPPHTTQLGGPAEGDYFMSKKEMRKQEKAAKKASNGHDNQSSLGDHSESTVDQPISEDMSRSVSDYVAAAAAAVLPVIDRSQSPSRRKSEPHDFDRQNTLSERQHSLSKSTPTSPVHERRPSFPSHAFDDLDILPGSKRPKKTKRNSLFNSPTIGSPLRSAMTLDEYIEPISAQQTTEPEALRTSVPHEDDQQQEEPSRDDGAEETKAPQQADLPSPESERGAPSVASAPDGREGSGRRHKSRKSRHEFEEPESHRRSASVAVSEPLDSYERSRKHRHRSHRGGEDFDDVRSETSARSHSSRRGDEESKSKKRGGLLSLFRRKSLDNVSVEDFKRKPEERNHSKDRHRHQSSSHASGDGDDRRSSTSRSRVRDESTHDGGSRHSSTSRHRHRHHRGDSVDDDASSQVSESRRRHKHRHRDESISPEDGFDDTRSNTSESKHRHRRRHRDHGSEGTRSPSRDSKSHFDQDQSFLAERVEDEESMPLPATDILPPSQTPESVDQAHPSATSLLPHESSTAAIDESSTPQMSRGESDEYKEITSQEQLDVTTSRDQPDQSDQPQEVQTHEDIEIATSSEEANTSQSPPQSPLSPTNEMLTPARPIIPLRVSSSTTIPLRFRYPPTSPGLPKERSLSFSAPTTQSPLSPVTPKARRPLSTEFTHSTEFRPLYLLERTRKTQAEEKQDLPSLPPSRTTSRSSSLQSSEEWESAAEEFDPSGPNEQDSSVLASSHRQEPDDVLGSTQTTPKAMVFPADVLDTHQHSEPEYYSWSDMEREERLRQEAEKESAGDIHQPQESASEHRVEPTRDNEHLQPVVQEHDIVNVDPMATDVWGEVSDNDQQSGIETANDEQAVSAVAIDEPEASQVARTTSSKKRKKKKAAILGTSSVSEDTSPSRETPAELRQRREQDAQDAVDTWFKPATQSNVEDSIEASQVPLPKESTTPLDEGNSNVKVFAGIPQESEQAKDATESASSPLLTRKKSKKGKKKQKALLMDESPATSSPTQGLSESEAHAETIPEDTTTMKPESQEDATTSQPTEVHEQEHFVGSSKGAPADEIAVQTEPTDREQESEESRNNQSTTPMSKAERKKQKKKAKKSALSIAVPAATGLMTASTGEEAEETRDTPATGLPGAGVPEENQENPLENLVNETTEPVLEPNEEPLKEDQSSAEVLHTSRPDDGYGQVQGENFETEHHDTIASSVPEPIDENDTHTQEPGTILEQSNPVVPGQPGDNLQAPDSIAVELPPSVETSLPADRSMHEDVVQPGQEESDDVKKPGPSSSDATVDKEGSQWRSWLPSSMLHRSGDSKDETVPEEVTEDASSLPQEPFEHLLEQPASQPEVIDKPILDDTTIHEPSSEAFEETNQEDIGAQMVAENTIADENQEFVAEPGITIAKPEIEHNEPVTSAVPTEAQSPSENAELATEESHSLNKTATDTEAPQPSNIESTQPVIEPSTAESSENITKTTTSPTEEEKSVAFDIPELVLEDDSWTSASTSAKSKKGKKGKKSKKGKASPADAETSLEPAAAPAAKSEDGQQAEANEDNAAETLGPQAANEDDSPSRDMVSDIPSQFEAAHESAVNATEPISSSNLEPALENQEGAASATEPSAETSASEQTPVLPELQPHLESTPIVEQQSSRDEADLNVEPLSQPAQDQWATPASKKKKKKGKKGKQSGTESFEQTAAPPVEVSNDIPARPIEDIVQEDTAPASPEVFETPTEGTSGQYFETPADERAEQYFVTPAEEVPEHYFSSAGNESVGKPLTAEEDDRKSPIQHGSRSATPTQESMQVVSTTAPHDSSTLEQETRDASSLTSRVDESPAASEPQKEETVDPEPRQEVPETENPEIGLAQPLTGKPELPEMEFVEMAQNASSPTQDSQEPPVTAVEGDSAVYQEANKSSTQAPLSENVAAEPIPQPSDTTEADMIAEPALSKKSKKDKRKAKKAKQRGEDLEEPSAEAIDSSSPAVPEQLVEAPVESESPTATESEPASLPALPETTEPEPGIVEDQPFARKLSKKEKKKSKKASAKSESLFVEDPVEQAPASHSDKDLPSEPVEETGSSKPIQAEALTETAAAEPDFSPTLLGDSAEPEHTQVQNSIPEIEQAEIPKSIDADTVKNSGARHEEVASAELHSTDQNNEMGHTSRSQSSVVEAHGAMDTLSVREEPMTEEIHAQREMQENDPSTANNESDELNTGDVLSIENESKNASSLAVPDAENERETADEVPAIDVPSPPKSPHESQPQEPVAEGDIHSPESAAVQDQAPSVLDQVVLTSEPVNDDATQILEGSAEDNERIRDTPAIENAEQGEQQAMSDALDTSEKPELAEEPVPTTEKLVQPQQVAPMGELAPEDRSIAIEEQPENSNLVSESTENADMATPIDQPESVPRKLSKKEKRKAKKGKPLSSNENEIDNSQVSELETPLGDTAEANTPAMTADQEPAVAEDYFPAPDPVGEPEVRTAKLSKKAKKKAKKGKETESVSSLKIDGQSPSIQDSEVVPGTSLDEQSVAPVDQDQAQALEVEPSRNLVHDEVEQPVAHLASQSQEDIAQEPDVDPIDMSVKDLSGEEAGEVKEEPVVPQALLDEPTIQEPVTKPSSLPDPEPSETATQDTPKEPAALRTTQEAQVIVEDEHTGDPDQEVAVTPEVAKSPGAIPVPDNLAPTSLEPPIEHALDPEVDFAAQNSLDIRPKEHVETAGDTDILDLPSKEDDKELQAKETEKSVPVPMSKKDKKKAKKAKNKTQVVEPEVLDTEAVQAASSANIPAVTDQQEINDERLLQKSDDVAVQQTTGENPETTPETDWAVPAKPSKKDKRKAKKAKDTEEPLPVEATGDLAEEAATSIEEQPLASEIADRGVEDEKLEAAPQAGPEPEEWNLSRKVSKKEKRKAKKAQLNEEQREPLSTAEPLETDEHNQAVSVIDDNGASMPLSLESQVEATPSKETQPTDVSMQSGPRAGPATNDVPEPEVETTQTSAPRDAASGEKEPECQATPVVSDNQKPGPNQDIDFAATLAAGLQDSGFDPNLVIDDPVFHRRASPKSMGEADPEEYFGNTTRRRKKSGGTSRVVSPSQKPTEDDSAVEQIKPAEISTNDDFSDALTAGLVASGFAPEALAQISTNSNDTAAKPDEFSFAVPKRKKKNKKGKQSALATPDVQTPSVVAEPETQHHPTELPANQDKQQKTLASPSMADDLVHITHGENEQSYSEQTSGPGVENTPQALASSTEPTYNDPLAQSFHDGRSQHHLEDTPRTRDHEDETPSVKQVDVVEKSKPPTDVSMNVSMQANADTGIPVTEDASESSRTPLKRSAKPNFFHTSEVSQFLPVLIDGSTHLDEHARQKPTTIEGSASVSVPRTEPDVRQANTDDFDTASNTEPQPQIGQIHTIPLTGNEQPTWSFANLESPVAQKPSTTPEFMQGEDHDDPFRASVPAPQIVEHVVDVYPFSPVESTTKDRTSYLFQSPVDVPKQIRFDESAGNTAGRRTPPAPLPPSPSGSDTIPLPPTPARAKTPAAPLPPSPRERALTPAPLPPLPQFEVSPSIHRKKSRDVSDVGTPGPGHAIKAARRTSTPRQSFREHTSSETKPENSANISSGTHDEGVVPEDGYQVPTLRPISSQSNRSTISDKQVRPPSSASNHSAAPSLRRINRSLSGDLRAASRRGDTHGPKTIPIQPPPTPPLQEEDEGFNGHAASGTSDMADVYVSNLIARTIIKTDHAIQEGWGDVHHGSSSISPTRPPSMRKRQSMHILDLEAKLDQLASENRYLQDAIDYSASIQPSKNDDSALQDALKTRDLQLQEKDSEIQQIRSLLEPLQREIARLTEVNANLSESNRNSAANNDVPYATLQNQHAHAQKQLQLTSQELETLRKQHNELSDGMEDIVRQEIANALEDKNAEIRKLREELDLASQRVRLLQSEILASKGDNFLTLRDEDYFDTSCQKLCQHVQQWVLRFSKYSDNRMCRLTSDLTDEKIQARLDNAILDGSDVDKLLGDRIRRRDVFMSVVMTMIWEYIFTRYLFGMDREQRQKLKSLEKILSEVGPPRAVAQWRATTLTLLSRRPAFATQRNLDTEAVAQEIFSVLSALLPPPAQLETQIMSSLRNVLRVAVELSIEMRSQKAEYIMLPPLQPEYDTQGDLVRKVHFNAALMNERSGDYSSNDELEKSQAVVKIVLFPLVVKKGDEIGEGKDEIVVCPAQVLVAGSKLGKKVVRVLSGAMDIDDPRRSNHSVISGMDSGGMI